MRRGWVMGACVFALGSVMAVSESRADVVEASAGGFTVKTTVTVSGTPLEAWRKLTANVGDWWDSEHTFSGDAHNLSIEARAAGCFCERLADQGGVRHLEVVFAAPGKTLRMVGGLGPLQAMALNGVMTFSFAPTAQGTTVQVTYAVGGYTPQGLAALAPVVDGVLSAQITRYKSYVDTGRPTAK
jgi:hypothetical protein